MPFWISRKGPLVLFVVGAFLALFGQVGASLAAPFFMVAFFWVFLTGSARKTYLNARLRARAYHDEREYQSGAASLR